MGGESARAPPARLRSTLPVIVSSLSVSALRASLGVKSIVGLTLCFQEAVRRFERIQSRSFLNSKFVWWKIGVES
jgi:hypothetical protein